MGEKGYGQMLAEGFVRAIPWAIVFSLTVLVTARLLMGMLAPEIKKGIEYGANAVITGSVGTALSNELLPKIKQNAKEAIEFTVTTVDNKLIKSHEKQK
ncbi:MAG: hypothetical protein AAB093_01805 [Nitrospirota bacterium]|jgi:hypothetical protein